MLQSMLKGAMEDKRLSLRELSKELGVSHTTVMRAINGESIDLATLIKIAEWLNIRPSALLDTLGDDAQVEAKKDLLLQAYPELQDVLEKAAVAVENGQADPALIRDIVAYAEYRIKSTSGGSNS